PWRPVRGARLGVLRARYPARPVRSRHRRARPPPNRPLKPEPHSGSLAGAANVSRADLAPSWADLAEKKFRDLVQRLLLELRDLRVLRRVAAGDQDERTLAVGAVGD